MTILGRFDRREKRRGFDRLFRRPTAKKLRRPNQQLIKRTMGGSFSFSPFVNVLERIDTEQHHENSTIVTSGEKRPSRMNNVVTNPHPLSRNTTFRKLQLNAATTAMVRQAVLEHLGSTSSKTSKVIDMAVALGQREDCKSSYAVELTDQPLTSAGLVKDVLTIFRISIPDAWSWAKHDKKSMKRRYDWVGAFEELEKRPSSREIAISSWDEARAALEEILIFTDPSPSDERDVAPIEASAGSIRDKHSKKLDAAISLIDSSNDVLSGANLKWRHIAAVSVPKKLRDAAKDDGGEQDLADLIQEEETTHKADVCFNARIQTAEELDEALRRKSDVTILLEERMKAAQAKKRAASLMRPLSDDERDMVHQAVFGYGGGDDIVAQCGSDSVQRSSMQTLRPGTWLNDEIIHYFYLMLANRDVELCEKDPSRKRSHFFKSFFITKLLNEGNANPAIDGTYEYRNVKRWSKNVPGKDIFGLDKIVFPINMGGMHWICATVFMKDKRIEIFDSMGAGGERYLRALFQYLQDEHEDKKKSPLPDVNKWELVPTQGSTPRQRNGYDCGVFTCMFADFVSKDCPLVFSQDHIDQCRERIALSILNGKAIM